MNYKDYIVLDKNLIRPSEVETLLANYSKAKKILNWQPKISFDNLVTEMVESDLELVTNKGNGLCSGLCCSRDVFEALPFCENYKLHTLKIAVGNYEIM